MLKHRFVQQDCSVLVLWKRKEALKNRSSFEPLTIFSSSKEEGGFRKSAVEIFISYGNSCKGKGCIKISSPIGLSYPVCILFDYKFPSERCKSIVFGFSFSFD